MNKRLIVFLTLGFLCLMTLGCGGKKEAQMTKPPAVTPPAAGTSAAPNLEAGKKVFETYCVTCHGTGGKGDGPAGKILNPPPQNFTVPKAMSSFTGDQLKEIIKNGKGQMPSWSATLKEEDITNVLYYIRHFANISS